MLAPLSAVNRATVEQDRAEVLHGGGPAARGGAGPAGGRRGVRLAAAAHLPGRVRALPGPDAAAPGPGPRAGRGPPGGTALPRPGQPGSGAARGRRWRSPRRSPAARGARRPLARADELAATAERGRRRRATRPLLALLASRVAAAPRRARRRRRAAAARPAHRRLADPHPPARARGPRRARRGARRAGAARDGHVRAGLADLHAWQSSFGSLDLQSTLVGHGRDLARLGLRLALDTREAGTVFEWSERARALAGRVTPVRPPLDQQLADDLTELRLLKQPCRRPRGCEELRDRVRQRQWYAAGPGAVAEPADAGGAPGRARARTTRCSSPTSSSTTG